MAKKTTKNQKMTAMQRKEREERALRRKQEQEAKQAKSNLLKRIFIFVVCAILVIALSLPTMGLMVLGGAS